MYPCVASPPGLSLEQQCFLLRHFFHRWISRILTPDDLFIFCRNRFHSNFLQRLSCVQNSGGFFLAVLRKVSEFALNGEDLPPVLFFDDDSSEKKKKETAEAASGKAEEKELAEEDKEQEGEEEDLTSTEINSLCPMAESESGRLAWTHIKDFFDIRERKTKRISQIRPFSSRRGRFSL